MLSEIHIHNFALIENLNLSFGPGFNVLTGETGAGKSIVLDAINAILGERLSAEVIRSGSAQAMVEAVFDLSTSPDILIDLVSQGVLEQGDPLLVVSREFFAGGKSQARIGGRLASVSLLREVGRNLVDVHGQHEHQSLLNPAKHLEALDNWRRGSVNDLRRQCAAMDSERRRISREIAQIQAEESQKAQRLELLQFQAREIDDAHILEGEEQALLAERTRLANMERLMGQVSEARKLLTGYGGLETGAQDAAMSAVKLVMDASRDDHGLVPTAEALQNAAYLLQEAARDLGEYHEGLETDPARLEEVEDRLQLLSGLQRKYRGSLDEILAYRQNIDDEMSQIQSADKIATDLQELHRKVTLQLEDVADRLTTERKIGATDLENQIRGELADLALADARFLVQIYPQEIGPSGADRVEFLFSANLGEPPRPLARIVSGGEISRIMLALKSLLASSMGVPTVIFDEVDVGVGGRTGEAIGEKLWAVGCVAQVICVTHLPQVAARSNHHFHIQKEVVDERTIVRARELSVDGRLEEIARMLGGGRGTALRHAHDMLQRCSENVSSTGLEPGLGLPAQPGCPDTLVGLEE